MPRLAWFTDLHLNFMPRGAEYKFIHSVASLECDAVLLGGDIGHAETLLPYLWAFDQMLACPVYFVLGNHDYYNGSIAGTRRMVRDFCRASRRLKYLPDAGVVQLSKATCLIGCDGWGDGRCGDSAGTTVVMDDHFKIAELSGLERPELLRRLACLGDEAAEYLQRVLPAALAEYGEIILLTHVPPFRESCWHRGSLSDDDYLPYFVCLAAGHVLRQTLLQHPNCRLTVLCGHTHGEGVTQVLDNLIVRTGGAVYGAPKLQDIVRVG